MLQIIKRLTRSTKNRTAVTNTSNLNLQEAIKLFLSSVNIHNLTLIKFIACLCDGNYRVLGNATDELLKEAWNAIYEEYIHLLEDAEQIRIMTLSKEINELETNHARLELIIMRLSYQHSDEIVEILKRMILVRSSLKPGPNYLRELEAVKNAASTWLVQIADKKKELDEVIPKGSGEKVDRKYMDKLITSVSKHMKFRINKNEITTAEFASYVRDMRETYDEINRQNQKAA